MAEFLLELRFGNPGGPGMLAGVQRLGHRFFEELMSRGLRFRQLATALGPERAALAILGLPEAEGDAEHRLWGPAVVDGWRDDQASPALAEFAASVGRGVGELARLPTPAGPRFAAIATSPGRAIGQVMAELARDLLGELGGSGALWPEPAGILAISEGRPVPFVIGGLHSSGSTVDPAGLSQPIASYEHYRQVLGAAGAPLWTLAAAREALGAGKAAR